MRQVNNVCRPLQYLISWWHSQWKFVYHVRAVAVHAPDHVTFYADNVYVHYVDRFVPSSLPQYTLRQESQRSNAVGLAKVYSVCTSNLVSHRVVVCAERNRIFSTLIIIVMSTLLLLLLLLSSLCQRFQARHGYFHKIPQKFIYVLHFIRTLGNNFHVVFGEIKFIIRFVHVRVISLKNR